MKRVYIAGIFEMAMHNVFDSSSMLNRSFFFNSFFVSMQIKAIMMGLSILYLNGSHVFSIIMFFCS